MGYYQRYFILVYVYKLIIGISCFIVDRKTVFTTIDKNIVMTYNITINKGHLHPFILGKQLIKVQMCVTVIIGVSIPKRTLKRVCFMVQLKQMFHVVCIERLTPKRTIFYNVIHF